MRSDSIHSASSSAFDRHHFPVVRPIGIGRTVERRARALQRLEVAVIVMLRALEHQVLEEMREARAAGLLVLRSDVIPEVDRNDRTARDLRAGGHRARCASVCLLNDSVTGSYRRSTSPCRNTDSRARPLSAATACSPSGTRRRERPRPPDSFRPVMYVSSASLSSPNFSRTRSMSGRHRLGGGGQLEGRGVDLHRRRARGRSRRSRGCRHSP